MSAAKLSALDLSPITLGGSPADSFRNSLSLAQHAESLGFNRYWVAEHHGMAGIASAATSVLVGHIAGGARRIRVGAGGIMLPNHSPLVIAEQFGTLQALYPGRIDCGLGCFFRRVVKHKLTKKVRTQVGGCYSAVQYGWPLALVRDLTGDLWGWARIAWVIFARHANIVDCLHGFIKSTQKTPSHDLAVGLNPPVNWSCCVRRKTHCSKNKSLKFFLNFF